MLSVIVPAYNEHHRLPTTLLKMREYLDSTKEEYEVIVVDDGSTDSTVSDIGAGMETWPQLSLIRQDPNQGKGAAVRIGMLSAQGELRLFSDADLSTPMDELPKLRERLNDRCQVAIASRAIAGHHIEVHQPGMREVMGRVYNRILQWMVLPGLQDTQCGFKLFTAESAVACFEPLRTQRFGFDPEVLLRARRQGWEIAEVPVRWAHREDSRVSAARDSLTAFVDLLKLRFRKL